MRLVEVAVLERGLQLGLDPQGASPSPAARRRHLCGITLCGHMMTKLLKLVQFDDFLEFSSVVYSHPLLSCETRRRRKVNGRFSQPFS